MVIYAHESEKDSGGLIVLLIAFWKRGRMKRSNFVVDRGLFRVLNKQIFSDYFRF
jgi:hypothetical protein